MKQLLIFLVVFLIACAVQTSSPSKAASTSATLKTITNSSNTAQTTAVQTAAPESKIKSCDFTEDKVVVFYDNGQRETFKPYCPEKDEPAFKSFRQEYYCDGLTVKSKLTRCTGNKTCLKGECV